MFYLFCLLFSCNSSLFFTNEEEEENQELEIYPNPAHDIVFVKTSIESNDAGEINIYDITGKLIISQSIKNTLSSVDVHELAQGVYTVKVTINNEISSQIKLVITK